MIDPMAARMLGIMTAWLLTLNALRYMVVGLNYLWPLIKGVWKLFTGGATRRDVNKRKLVHTVDMLGVVFLDLLASPVTLMLIFASVVLIGLGVALDGFGDVALSAARSPGLWEDLERTTTWISAPIVCLGMAAMLAAFSRNRTLSVAISCAWMLTGLGVGAIIVVAGAA